MANKPTKNSLRFFELGAPLAPLSKDDVMIGSTSVNNPTVQRDVTVGAYAQHVTSYMYIANKSQQDLYSFGEGLSGRGYDDDPLGSDPEWFKKRYAPRDMLPFSQVGDFSDDALPISGSYFSVSFPYYAHASIPTGYVEGNGDLKMLHHVTNGEDIRAVYATWKNYRTSINRNDFTLTDIAYAPPGLRAGEFVSHVFTCSENAMIIEISNANGLVNFGYVDLNGTLRDVAHSFIRIDPAELFGILYDARDAASFLGFIHSSNIAACTTRGERYIFGLNAFKRDLTNSNAAVVVKVMKLVDKGTGVWGLEFISGTATNSEMNVNVGNGYGHILHQKATTADINDKDGFLYMQDGIVIQRESRLGADCAATITCPGIAVNGNPYLVLRYRLRIDGPVNQVGCSPVEFCVFDVKSGNIDTGESYRRWELTLDASKRIVVNHRSYSYDGDMNYYTRGIQTQFLTDGNRISWRYGANGLDVTPEFHIQKSKRDVRTITDSVEDSNFKDDASKGATTSLVNKAPTLTLPGYLPYLHRGNLVTTNIRSNYTNSVTPNARHVRNKLVGSETARNYKLLQPAGNELGVLETKGYALNNDRVAVKATRGMMWNFVSKTGTIYYHNATFTVFTPPMDNSRELYLDQDVDMLSDRPFMISKVASDKFKAVVDAIRIPNSTYAQQHSTGAWLVPFHPELGPFCFFTIWVVDKTENKDSVLGWDYSPIWQYSGVVGASYVAIDNDPKKGWILQDINLDNLGEGRQINNTFYDITYDITTDQNGGGVIKQMDDGRWFSCTAIGCGARSAQSSSPLFYTRYTNYDAQFNRLINTKVLPSDGLFRTYFDSKLGFGHVVGVDGLGTFYTFRHMDEATGDYTGKVTVLGSARPSADFTLILSASIEMYVNGILATIEPGLFDLTKIKSNPANTTFYLYANLVHGSEAELLISTVEEMESDTTIYVGHCRTSATEIAELVTKPVTRWDNKRPSTLNIGSGIPVSTGSAGSESGVQWGNQTGGRMVQPYSAMVMAPVILDKCLGSDTLYLDEEVLFNLGENDGVAKFINNTKYFRRPYSSVSDQDGFNVFAILDFDKLFKKVKGGSVIDVLEGHSSPKLTIVVADCVALVAPTTKKWAIEFTKPYYLSNGTKVEIVIDNRAVILGRGGSQRNQNEDGLGGDVIHSPYNDVKIINRGYIAKGGNSTERIDGKGAPAAPLGFVENYNPEFGIETDGRWNIGGDSDGRPATLFVGGIEPFSVSIPQQGGQPSDIHKLNRLYLADRYLGTLPDRSQLSGLDLHSWFLHVTGQYPSRSSEVFVYNIDFNDKIKSSAGSPAINVGRPGAWPNDGEGITIRIRLKGMLDISDAAPIVVNDTKAKVYLHDEREAASDVSTWLVNVTYVLGRHQDD